MIMTLDEGIKRFQHDVEETLHDVEEKLRDVRDHMIISVERYSIAIALVLMGITTVVLIVGTLVVWWRHRHEKHEQHELETEHDPPPVEKVVREDSDVINNNYGCIGNGVPRHRSPKDTTGNSSKGNSPTKSRLPVRTKVKSS